MLLNSKKDSNILSVYSKGQSGPQDPAPTTKRQTLGTELMESEQRLNPT